MIKQKLIYFVSGLVVATSLCFAYYTYKIQPTMDRVAFTVIDESIVNAEQIRGDAAALTLTRIHDHLMEPGKVEGSLDDLYISGAVEDRIHGLLKNYREKHTP